MKRRKNMDFVQVAGYMSIAFILLAEIPRFMGVNLIIEEVPRSLVLQRVLGSFVGIGLGASMALGTAIVTHVWYIAKVKQWRYVGFLQTFLLLIIVLEAIMVWPYVLAGLLGIPMKDVLGGYTTPVSQVIIAVWGAATAVVPLILAMAVALALGLKQEHVIVGNVGNVYACENCGRIFEHRIAWISHTRACAKKGPEVVVNSGAEIDID